MTPSSFKLQHTVVAMALAAIYPMQASVAASAGVAQFIAGDVNVRRADGGTAPLVKGKDIESGQAIVTGASGRAQVRFTDGGLVSLQPNTEFKVANYVDKADPKEDRFLVDLLRGSMRAVTGLIGKRNRENYKVTTTTATIGIRGSGFNAGYNPDGSLGVTTEFDGIEVCNAGGCIGLTAGESVRVVNNTDAPVRTNVRANVPTPPTETERIVIEKVNEEGKTKIVVDKTVTPTPPAPPAPPTGENGTFTNLTAVAHYHDLPVTSYPTGSFAGPVASASVVLSGSKATEFEASGSVFKPNINAAAGSFGSMATNDFIGWGNWSTGTKNGSTNLAEIHYLVGQATPVLPTTPGFATYTHIGGSTPTSYTGASGTLNSATLLVDFCTCGAGPVMDVTIDTSFGIVANTMLYFSSSTFSGSNASGTIKGMFTGPNANHAGLIYTGPLSPAGSFSGTAIFQAP